MFFRITARIVLLLAVVFGQLAAAPRAAAAPVPAVTAWIESQMEGGIIYLLYSSPAQIRRYSISGGAWLAPITLPAAPTAFRVSGSNLFVAFDRTLSRFNLDGTGRTDLWLDLRTIRQVLADDQYLVFCTRSAAGEVSTKALDRSKLEQYWGTKEVHWGVSDAVACDSQSILPGRQQIAARSTLAGSSSVFLLNYAAGTGTGPAVPGAARKTAGAALRTWASADSSRIVDDSGTVYAYNSGWAVTGLLMEGIQDVAFDGNLPVVLRDGKLVAYDERLVDRQEYAPALPPSNIFLSGSTVYAVASTVDGPVVQPVALSAFVPRSPAPAVDAYGLSYTVDGVAYDPSGVVYLMNKAARSVFRWSVAEREYLEPIRLVHEPQFITFSPVTGKLSIASDAWEITQVTPADSLAEAAFADLPAAPCALEAVGTSLVACTDLPADTEWRFATINAAGAEAASWTVIASQGQFGFAPNDALSRMYYVYRNGPSIYSFDVAPDGAVSNQLSRMIDFGGHTAPLRLSADGTRMFAGAGYVVTVSGDNLGMAGYVNETSGPNADAAWLGSGLYVLAATGPDGENGLLERANANGTIAATQAVPGKPVRLLAVSGGLLVISQYEGRPRFTMWSDQLQPLYQPPAARFSADKTSGGTPLAVQFTGQSTGAISYLWDFGDGQTSTDASPLHEYRQPGAFAVTLTVTGAGGEDRLVKPALVKTDARSYLPVVLRFSTAAAVNSCKTFTIYDSGGQSLGQITECVTRLEKLEETGLRVHLTWKLRGSWGCVSKKNDWLNPNMYLTDQYGNRYTMNNMGGDGTRYMACMEPNIDHAGWFDFPAAKVKPASVTFHDDDNKVQFGPIAVP